MLRSLVAHISLTRAPPLQFFLFLSQRKLFFFLLESLRDCSVGLLLSLPGRGGTGAGKPHLPLIATNKASQLVAEFSVTHHTSQLAWGSPPAHAHSIHQEMTAFIFLALYLMMKTNKQILKIFSIYSNQVWLLLAAYGDTFQIGSRCRNEAASLVSLCCYLE